MMDEHQSPSSNTCKKRKSAVALPSQKRCLIKKSRIAGDLAGTGASISQSRKFSFNSSPTSSNQSARVPSAKNAKAGPSTTPNAARSPSCELTTPTRVSSRVSRPTFKKQASSFVKRPRLPDSDGTPPLSIILPPSLKQKKSMSSPTCTKRLTRNNTPSKRKWLDPNPIELTSSDDDSQPQPPRKRIKRTHKKTFSSEVIDLCSDSEDVIASPRHTCTRDERSVVVLSTDEEVDPEFSALAFRKIDTRECPALSPLRDISPPIEIKSVFQASPSPLAHNTVPKPKAPVSEEDGVSDENNIYAEKVNLPRGSLQVLYNEALARCTREPRREKDIADQPSPFSSPKCVPPARIIRYATQTQSPSLHTPLFFSRIILRLRARLKQPKTLDAKAFSDARASFKLSNPKAFPDAAAFSDISNDTGLNSMEVSKLNEDQDTLTYPVAVMEISAVDGEALEMAAETIIMPPIDSQDDTSSDTQVASISPSILVNKMNLNERLVSQSLGSPSPLTNQESPLGPEVAILEDTPILHSIQSQRVSINCCPTTTDSANTSTISLCYTPPNSDAVNYQIETPQEAETSLFGREVATIEHIVLKDAQSFVQALQRIYDGSKIYEFSLHPALELNDTVKPSAAFEPLSESPTEYATITDTSSDAVHTSSTSKYLPELSMKQEMTLNLSSPAGPSNKNVSSGIKCIPESPAIPNLYPLARSSSADTLSSRALSLSTRSRQSPDSSATIENVNCHLLTPDDSPDSLTPLVKAQKQESLICSNPFPSPFGVSFDISELNLQTIMCNMYGEDDDDDDDDDDDISISGMELAYPES